MTVDRRRQFWALLTQPHSKAVHLKDLLAFAWFCGFKRHFGPVDCLLTHPAIPCPILIGLSSPNDSGLGPDDIQRFVGAVRELRRLGYLKSLGPEGRERR